MTTKQLYACSSERESPSQFVNVFSIRWAFSRSSRAEFGSAALPAPIVKVVAGNSVSGPMSPPHRNS
jgi:hypothetical protein